MSTIKNNLVILKIGGSVITDKKNDKKTINKKAVKRIIKEISQARNKINFSLIIIHGVGTFGHKIARIFDLQNGYNNKSQIRAISNLKLDIRKLNIEILKHLKKENINAVTFEQSSAWKMTNGRICDCNLSIINKYLKLNLTPVLYGDILIDNKLEFSILSGDQIIFYLAKKLKANKVIIGTDIDGVFNRDPKINKNAKLVKLVNKNNFNELSLGGSTAIDVTGGMKGKVNELLNLSEFKIKSKIINLTKPNVLKHTLLEENNFGTTIE